MNKFLYITEILFKKILLIFMSTEYYISGMGFIFGIVLVELPSLDVKMIGFIAAQAYENRRCSMICDNCRYLK